MMDQESRDQPRAGGLSLERDGVVQRTVYPEAPPKVEYSLTLRGQELKPVIEALWQWGKTVLDADANNLKKSRGKHAR
jgi:DNA-binding HxlR family transcriptional regulator